MRFETLQIHAGQSPDPTTKASAVPIYMSASYVFEDTKEATDVFALKKGGNIYTRIMNPTTDVFEKRIAALEGGVGALATSSGTSAVMYSILNIASCGDNIISASTLYGGTYNLFTVTLPKMGVNVKLVNSDYPEEFDRAVDKNTKAIFIETIGNPNTNLVDIEAISRIAKKHKIPLIVDNTFGTPYLVRPFEHGADIVVHAATKFLCGHGTVIAGAIVDSGRFDWAGSGRFPSFTEPDKSYHGIRFASDVGEAAYIVKARVGLLRDTGACISPFNSFLLLQGLETLSLRVERHVVNTKMIAEHLSLHKNVTFVNYPSLKGNKYYDLAKKYMPLGAGSIFTFGVKGGRENALKFIDSLKVFTHLANIADARSLVIHPASTTHSQLDERDLEIAGVSEDMIRLSIGTENVLDLIEDIDRALEIACN